jgi:large subunit ribosomal protein L3
MSGLIGRKVGMTSVFDETGNSIPCTVVEVTPNVVTQVKTAEGKDGYSAVQLAFSEAKEKRTTKAMAGHFEKAGTTPKRKVVEFRDYDEEVGFGDEVSAVSVFQPGDVVHVIGRTKGKGFQGVVKRHGFAGVGSRTHGQHNRERAPGSIGASSDPSRVMKGMRMAGRKGGERVTVRNLKVVQILDEQNAILIKGALPGPKGSYVTIHKG